MKTTLLKTAFAAVLVVFTMNLHAFTAVTSGAWSSATTWGGVGPGATVSNQDIIIPSGITVNLDVDVSFSGLLNTFTVDGTLNSSSNNGVVIGSGAFAGSGNVNIQRLSFSGLLTTTTFTGSAVLGVFQNQGAALTMAAMVNVSDTLDLDDGSIVLNTGANLTMEASSNVRVDQGTLTSTGGVFSTGSMYNVWYFGTSKTTGLEVNSSNLQDLHVDLSNTGQTLALGISSVTVNGTLHMVTGAVNLSGNDLTIEGNLMLSSNAEFQSNATSSLTIAGTGALNSGLDFNTGASIDELTIDRPGSTVMLESPLNIAGTVYLLDGDLSVESGGDLVMNANSTIHIEDGGVMLNGGNFTGVNSYNVEYTGGALTSDVELGGAGLNDVTLNLSSATTTITLGDDVIINGELSMMMGKLDLDGNDLDLMGTLDQHMGTAFEGDSTSSMSLALTAVTSDTLWFGTDTRLEKLEIDLPLNGMITLGSDIDIYDEADLVNGSIDVANYKLVIHANATITGYSNSDYVITSGTGGLQIYLTSGSGYRTFPVGTANLYAPAYIDQTSSGNSGYFVVTTMPGVYSNGTTGFNSATTEGVVNNTWLIIANQTVNVNMNLKLGWETSGEVNGFNRTQAYVTHYMNNAWDSYLLGSASTGPNSTYELIRTGITSLSPFAVVDSSAVLAIEEPVTMATFNVFPNPATDFVNVTVKNENNDVYQYELFDATGKAIVTIKNSNNVNQFDLSNLSFGYYFIKITNMANNTFVTKRVVKS